jgi:hypothetical protein
MEYRTWLDRIDSLWNEESRVWLLGGRSKYPLDSALGSEGLVLFFESIDLQIRLRVFAGSGRREHREAVEGHS